MIKKIGIIATTMSGSIKDQMKVGRIEPGFKKYFSDVKLYKADSHGDAYLKAKELVDSGVNIVVAAGGAGTINSVVRGCHESSNVSKDLRIGVIRKGSADLIGKVLKISDNLDVAIRTIAESINKDKYINIDLIQVSSSIDNKDYFVGFGGLGVFGGIPYFTENKLKKYYKGILGFLFGDRGPFFIGAILSSITFYTSKIFNRDKSKFEIIFDKNKKLTGKWNSIIILNGDLGKHFPVAPDCPLDDGKFRVVLLKDMGLFKLISQFAGCWSGKILKDSKLGGEFFDVTELDVYPCSEKKYFVNVDGLLKKEGSSINFKIVDQLKMYYGG